MYNHRVNEQKTTLFVLTCNSDTKDKPYIAT